MKGLSWRFGLRARVAGAAYSSVTALAQDRWVEGRPVVRGGIWCSTTGCSPAQQLRLQAPTVRGALAPPGGIDMPNAFADSTPPAVISNSRKKPPRLKIQPLVASD